MAESVKKKMHINFILDKSGSMMSVKRDTVGGFNNYLEALRKETDIDYVFTLTTFDTQFHEVHVSLPLADVKALDDNTYLPGGYTALYDAIGATVRKVSADGIDKVLTVIMTDGHENSSYEWNLDQIKALIAEKEGLGNWTFVFLGATPDAWDIGMGLGVPAGNVARYDPLHIMDVYQRVAHDSSSLARSSARASRSMFSGGNSTGFQTVPKRPPVTRPETPPGSVLFRLLTAIALRLGLNPNDLKLTPPRRRTQPLNKPLVNSPYKTWGTK